MKNWLKKFIDKLAKANEESFGDKPLDCCSLNKENNSNNQKKQ